MTSEPDSKPSRRPPTIDLEATEVDPPASAARSGDTDAGSETAQPHRPGRMKAHAISAGLGAVAMAAIIGGLWLSGFRPSHQAAAPAAPTAPTSAAAPVNGPDIAAQLAKLERAVQAQHNDPNLSNRITAAEAQTKALADSLAALNRRLDDIAATSAGASKQADAAQATAEAAKSASQTAIQKGDIEPLAGRVAALENAIKVLSEDASHPTPSTDDHTARLTIASEALRAAVERSAPYQSELNAVQSLGVESSATTPLGPYAATGIPSAAALARELAGLMPTLRRAADATGNATTFLGRLEAHAEHLVRITPATAPAGNDPSAVLTRLNFDAAHGDLTAALTDIAALPEAAQPVVADWVKKAQARDAAITASRQIAAGALAALVKQATQ